MPTKGLDDPQVVAAMAGYVEALRRLEQASPGAAELVDLADQAAMARMVLRKRLLAAGWSEPVPAAHN